MGLGVVSGAVAGAAGSTALNAATHLDMIIRGRPASSTPEETVEAIDDRTPGSIPGEDDSRSNRVSGLGALTGLTVMAVTDGATAKLGVSDLRRLAAADWVADLVPHLTYGAVTWSVLQALQDDRR